MSAPILSATENIPNMELIQQCYLLDQPKEVVSAAEKADIQKSIMESIKRDNMAPYYKLLCTKYGWQVDEDLLKDMEAYIAEALKKNGEASEYALESQGNAEVVDLLIEKANLFMKVGDKDAALAAMSDLVGKGMSTSQKIDNLFDQIRLGMFFSDTELVNEKVKLVKDLVEQGGDWDKRNRLKVYDGCIALSSRGFKKASSLFLDTVPTFSATEMCTYEKAIFYCVITNLLNLDRVTLKKKVVDSPEILGVLLENPVLSKLLNSLYDCKYEAFMEALVDINAALLRDRLLGRHARYLIRELRVAAYGQFLEAYRSVTVKNMANSFGVGIDFLDKELYRFISNGRLPAKIDKVRGVIETLRPDTKNARYQSIIKDGDTLLNRIQKLARYIDVEA